MYGIIRMIPLLILASLSLTASGGENRKPWVSDSAEVIYFFSLHCGECYKNEPYFSLSKIKAQASATFVKVPLTMGGNAEAGARLHFLLSLSKARYDLTELERSRAGYSLLLETPSLRANDKNAYSALFREYGMRFSAFEFEKWWADSTLLMEDAAILADQASEEKGMVYPGDIRVYNNGKVSWFNLSGNDKLSAVKGIIEAVNDENN